MAKLNDMYPSKWLKAEEIDGDDLVVTISDIRTESVGQGRDAGDKWVLYFNETDKGLVLNKTNAKAIAKLHGDDTDDWEGKRIALYATEVEYQGETMLGIRVRLKAPKARANGNASTAAPAPLAETDDDGVPIGDDGKPIF
jgi:hypothetical protein